MDCERIVDETLRGLVSFLGLREPLLGGLGHGSRDARGGTIGLDPYNPTTALRQTTSALAVLFSGASKECQDRASWFSWRRKVAVVLRMCLCHWLMVPESVFSLRLRQTARM